MGATRFAGKTEGRGIKFWKGEKEKEQKFKKGLSRYKREGVYSDFFDFLGACLETRGERVEIDERRNDKNDEIVGDKGETMEYRENRDVRRPFLAIPDARVYFPAAAIERARKTTERCLRRGEGIALVVGATGVGKTILTRTLAASFEAEDLTVVVTPSRKKNVKSFLQQVLFGLRQTFCGCDETELRLLALDYLQRSASRRFVLIVDDAQNLSFPVFDEIRVLVDQSSTLSTPISVALVGTNRLEERLNLPRFYPIQQRIAARAYLEAFDRAEVNDYVDGEMRRVGASIRFSSDAKNLIADLSDGSPRIVNQLSDRALVLAFGETVFGEDGAEGLERDRAKAEVGGEVAGGSALDRTGGFGEIGRDFIERAWANLQNWLEGDESDATDAAKDVGEDDVVEFGTLDDETDDDFNDSNRNDDSFKQKNENDANFNDLTSVSNGESAGEETRASGQNDENAEVSMESETLDDAIRGEKIDWEEERYGGFEKARRGERTLDDGSQVDVDAVDQNGVASEFGENEIDSEIEARLLAKFGASDVDSEMEAVSNADAEPLPTGVDFSENSEAKIGVQLEERASLRQVETTEANADSGEEGGVEISEYVDSAERNPQRRVFNALKSDDFNEGGGSAAATSENGDSNVASSDVASLTIRSKTRKPLTADDDGSRNFESVNGFSVDDVARADEADERERFWEASLTSDSVSGTAVYTGPDGAPDFSKNSRPLDFGEGGEFISLEDRAYRQIVEACDRTGAERSASEARLTELDLLEQEIEEGTSYIRRIRNARRRFCGGGRGEQSFDAGVLARNAGDEL